MVMTTQAYIQTSKRLACDERPSAIHCRGIDAYVRVFSNEAKVTSGRTESGNVSACSLISVAVANGYAIWVRIESIVSTARNCWCTFPLVNYLLTVLLIICKLNAINKIIHVFTYDLIIIIISKSSDLRKMNGCTLLFFLYA